MGWKNGRVCGSDEHQTQDTIPSWAGTDWDRSEREGDGVFLSLHDVACPEVHEGDTQLASQGRCEGFKH